jgi:invasion protein IalB
MTHRNFIAATMAGRVFAIIAMAAAVVLSSQSLAQQPAPKAQPKAPAPKAQPKGAPAAPAQEQQPEAPKLTYSPWTKVCPKGQEANAKAVCLTGRDGTVESGMPVVAAVLIEPEGEKRKTLRVTLPLGMALQPGTRVVIDQGQPMTAPYVICGGNGCMADYEASDELVANMKRGQGLAVQGLNGSGQVVSLVVPLADFAKAHDGPPLDPKAFEEMQRKRFEEFQNKQKSQ